MAAFGILAALRERERSGEGQLVDVSMFDGVAVVARAGGGALPRRAGGARSAATLELAGSADLLPALRLQGRLGHARRARAEVLAGVVPRRRARGPDREAVRAPGSEAHARGRADLPRAHARRVARVRLAARLLPRAGARTSTRRSTRSSCARARWWCELDQPGTDGVSLLGVPVKLSRTPGAPAGPGPGAGRAHARGAGGARLLGRARSPRCARRARWPGPPSGARGSFLA